MPPSLSNIRQKWSTPSKTATLTDFRSQLLNRKFYFKKFNYDDIKSTTGFPTSYRWSAYVTPKSAKGWLNSNFSVLRNKIQFLSNKVCYKVSFCENFQRQSCRAVNQLWNTVIFECINLQNPLLIINYVFRIFISWLNMKVTGSRSRSCDHDQIHTQWPSSTDWESAVKTGTTQVCMLYHLTVFSRSFEVKQKQSVHRTQTWFVQSLLQSDWSTVCRPRLS